MPTVLGTSGKVVTYELRGIAETINELTKKGKMVENEVELALVRAATFVKEEVKESIAGMRSEPQSVDTGNFLNSIQTDLIDKNTSSVNTDVEYAKFLEYGTVNITARQHFRNTEERTKDKVREEIDNAVKKAVE